MVTEAEILYLSCILLFTFVGIQFQIQRMGANDSADAYEESNPFRDNNIGVKKLLEFNSEVNHDDVCLAYVFTYRDFADGALGLAWMGETGTIVTCTVNAKKYDVQKMENQANLAKMLNTFLTGYRAKPIGTDHKNVDNY